MICGYNMYNNYNLGSSHSEAQFLVIQEVGWWLLSSCSNGRVSHCIYPITSHLDSHCLVIMLKVPLNVPILLVSSPCEEALPSISLFSSPSWIMVRAIKVTLCPLHRCSPRDNTIHLSVSCLKKQQQPGKKSTHHLTSPSDSGMKISTCPLLSSQRKPFHQTTWYPRLS